MLSRFVGVARGARAYSSVQKAESTLFLSDLMKRIDSINTRTKRIAEAKTVAKQGQKPQKNSNRAASKEVKAAKDTKMAKPAPKLRARNDSARIAVKDHPLSRNTFKLMDESNFKKPERARRGNPPSRAENRPASARNGPAAQNQRARPPRRTTPARPAPTTERIVQKELVVKDYKPAVSGDDFFHGKPASLAISTSSRVAAVAKETLLESKYPYKLPKSIIDKLDSSFAGNKFILQKDYTLDVDVATFGTRINQVVKGEVNKINIGEKPATTSVFTATQLARNGDLTIAQQQTIYDVASGLKSAKLLVEGAVWNK
ncbi:CIC11C00000002167 [Sungouiella intermedia]|uniref:CIC11C00000002167 n=1 Tax=Sungouiella intermedia TaxID=45354 RepID=A0A1L0BNI1_9ASCO|nr:CIC11C00000002167 [[Candida] intermedia]